MRYIYSCRAPDLDMFISMNLQTLLPMIKALLVILMAISFAASITAAEEISYTAYLSRKDRYNSNGERLTSVADILRQDRANFHKGGGDRADEDDGGIFATANGRAKFESYSIVLEALDAADLINGVQKGIMVRVVGRKIYVSGAEFEEEG
jgi:hypothetical protein